MGSFGFGFDLSLRKRLNSGGAVSPYAAYAFALRYSANDYWVSGTSYTEPTLPGRTFTRSGSQGAVDTAGAVAYFAGGVPAINNRGYHSYGALTNNLLNAGSAAGLSTQNVTTTATAYTLAIMGTGTVTLSGTSVVGPLVGTGATNQVALSFTPTAGTLTLTVTGSVTYAVLVGGTFAVPVPIITTGATTMALAESVHTTTINPYTTDQDFIVWVAAYLTTPSSTSKGEVLLILGAEAGPYIFLQRQFSTGLLVASISGGGGDRSAGISQAGAGRVVLMYRRLGGKDTFAVKKASTVTIGVESAVVAFPALSTRLASGYNANVPDGQDEGIFARTGTFDDAAITAILTAA